MLWRTSPLRARAGAVSAAEAEVLPPDGGPGSPGEGPGLEVSGRGPSAERLCDLAALDSYSKEAEQLVLEEGLGSSWGD